MSGIKGPSELDHDDARTFAPYLSEDTNARLSGVGLEHDDATAFAPYLSEDTNAKLSEVNPETPSAAVAAVRDQLAKTGFINKD